MIELREIDVNLNTDKLVAIVPEQDATGWLAQRVDHNNGQPGGLVYPYLLDRDEPGRVICDANYR